MTTLYLYLLEISSDQSTVTSVVRQHTVKYIETTTPFFRMEILVQGFSDIYFIYIILAPLMIADNQFVASRLPT